VKNADTHQPAYLKSVDATPCRIWMLNCTSFQQLFSYSIWRSLNVIKNR